ncbi:SMI1/KNR4 family protein [Lentzea sp. HUAS12]|uniref:SMI1/KNR4 family protein n=1 Tax=Lentzea sp. HUAS12 TaxID=2951806 RepID=UPI00209F8415|nr:SMI1/KNR4 family protein [Lentzea sp. HUAS12]USX49820.1 SMI1/KNR4 family protein [Lentzea sp. HUAS12]
MSWSRADAWLRRNAPTLRAKFLPPATATELAAAEEKIGAPLPADLAAWWTECGGLASVDYTPLIPEFYSPLGVAQALEVREMMMEIRRDFAVAPEIVDVDAHEARKLAEPAASPIGDLWLPLFVPVAVDASGTYLFADLRQGLLRGCVMQFDEVEGADEEPRWESVDAMLHVVVEWLEGDFRTEWPL